MNFFFLLFSFHLILKFVHNIHLNIFVCYHSHVLFLFRKIYQICLQIKQYNQLLQRLLFQLLYQNIANFRYLIIFVLMIKLFHLEKNPFYLKKFFKLSKKIKTQTYIYKYKFIFLTKMKVFIKSKSKCP